MVRGRRLVLVALALATVLVALPAAASSHKGRPTCDGKRATIVGTAGNDDITGTKAGDVIVTGPGNDVIHSLGGDDTICSGEGDDHVYGGTGSDTIFAEGGNDFVDGETGNEYIDGGSGNDQLDENAGDGTVKGGAGNDTIIGERGIDTLEGGPGNDHIAGGIGFDTLRGDGGTGLPGLVLIAWTIVYGFSVRRAVHYIPLRGDTYGLGFEAMLMNGVLAAAGLALIVPLFIPSRWRARTALTSAEARDATQVLEPTTISLTGDDAWTQTAPYQTSEPDEFP